VTASLKKQQKNEHKITEINVTKTKHFISLEPHTKRRWVDNIKMDLQEVGCGYVDWIGLAQDRDRWRSL
jgi:hypothetical protein